jgi:putative iron-dependent peroxidase
VHDLASFDRLPIEDQERVFGRTTADSAELSAGEKPPTAHIARVETEVDGAEIEVSAGACPRGRLRSMACTSSPSAPSARATTTCSRMFGLAGDGIHDRLTEFSRPVSGAYYFAPSLNALNELAGPEPD